MASSALAPASGFFASSIHDRFTLAAGLPA
jgi:hypothetical protein